MEEGNEKNKKVVDMTMSKAIIYALTANFEDEKELTGEEKVKRFMIAQKIYRKREGTIDSTAEEVALIKKLVGKAWGTIVVGKIWELLEK